MTPIRLVLVADRYLLDSELVGRRLMCLGTVTTCRPHDLAARALDAVDLVLLDAEAAGEVVMDVTSRARAVGLLHDGRVPRHLRADPGVRLLLARDLGAAAQVTAVSRVLDGGVHRDRSAPEGAGAQQPSLSPRESDVLTLLARGLANRDIADELDISPHTVRTHVQALLVKLGRGNRVAAVGAARQAGLLPR